MRKTTWMIPVAFALGGVALGWLLFSGTEHAEDAAHATAEEEHVDHAPAAAAQVYTCSMHPQVRSTDPKAKCPICGMDLIPVPADDEPDDAAAGDPPRLRLTSRAAALMQVQVQPAQRRAVRVPIRLYGRLDYDETRLRTIATWTAGRLERLYVDFTGTAVERGQPMVDLYSPMLIAAQEELLQALEAAREMEAGGNASAMETARLTVEASRDRLRLLGLDAAQIGRVEQNGRVEDYLTIPAPLSGTVIERLAATGDYVETGQPIYRVADLSRLWVQLEVYESDLAWLNLGQPATFTTQSYPGEAFSGTVAFIDPVLDAATRTVRVRVDVPNAEGRLKPGMFVRGSIEASVAGDEPLVIPATAPLLTGERAVVYVQVADADRPTYEPRDVTLGPRAGAWFMVRKGLREGDLVVTHGNFKIDSELQIRGQPSMMQPQGGRPPTHEHGEQTRDEPVAAAATQDDLDAYPLDICVVTDLSLDSMGGPVQHEHDGQVVLFCCDGCLPKFLQNPAYYLGKLAEGERQP